MQIMLRLKSSIEKSSSESFHMGYTITSRCAPYSLSDGKCDMYGIADIHTPSVASYISEISDTHSRIRYFTFSSRRPK